MIIRDYQISKQTKQEVESSIFCLQILSMYTEVTKRKSLMMREEYGLKGYEQETQRRKKQKLPISMPRYSISLVKEMESETIR